MLLNGELLTHAGPKSSTSNSPARSCWRNPNIPSRVQPAPLITMKYSAIMVVDVLGSMMAMMEMMEMMEMMVLAMIMRGEESAGLLLCVHKSRVVHERGKGNEAKPASYIYYSDGSLHGSTAP